MRQPERFYSRRERGFTLVELLVVVAIIATITAIALPMFNKYKFKGFKTELDTDSKNAYTAAQAYLIDNVSATVNTVAKLKAGGYKKSGSITLVGGSMTAGSGSIELSSVVLKARGMDNNAVIFWNGRINFANSP